VNEEPEAASGDERMVADRYRLLAPLGQGGMGVVWRARDELLGREVAVKEVRAPAALGTGDVQRLYSRLEREAWAAARVAHRNVVTVYDVATENGRPWIVMELVRGLSFADVLGAEGPMEPRRAAGIGAEVLAALRAAHEAGVLHRDVKPGNVLLGNDGRVVLTDFGIAMIEGSSALTITGEVVGSPEFLAPERALGRKPGPESDLWSLGVLLYAAVEGRSPFRQDTPLSTLRAVVDEELPPSRRAGPLTSVIEGLLHKDPAERLSAAEAERLLRAVAAGGTPGNGTAPTDLPSPPGRAAPTAPRPESPTDTQGLGAAGSARTGPTTGPLRATPSPLPGPAVSDERHPGRARVVLVAGVLALLLALGGLAWTLFRDDGNSPGGTAGSASGGTGGQNADGGGSGGGTDGGVTYGDTGGTPDETTSSTPPPSTSKPTEPQTVEVHVTAVRDNYTGTCPPPKADAPYFTATITVRRVPAQVEYRWVTTSGEVTEPGWKTLHFAPDGGESKQIDHTELTHHSDGTLNNEISVEIRKPLETKSEPVAFWVTCQKPTDSEEPTTGESGDY
jgi:hypothetical protein